MASELLLLAAAPPSIVSTATTTSTAADGTTTTTSTGTTISSLSADDLHEIFLRLPDLPALVRAALTCRSWLGAVRASPPFRRLFRALHPAPLIIGTFLQLTGATFPIFAPMRLSGDTDVTAILRHGDFLLTTLPHSPLGWTVTDCRDGCILLSNNDTSLAILNPMTSLAILNPMTWDVEILPPLECINAGSSDGGFALLGVHLPFSDEKPLYRVIYICKDDQLSRVRFATFSSKTWDWDIHPWVDIGGDISLMYRAASLVDATVYWPCHGQDRVIKSNIDTLDKITVVDLPGHEEVDLFSFKAGETKDGEHCIVYESDLSLSVWILSIDNDGTEIWEPWGIIPLAAEIDQLTKGITQDMHSFIDIVQVRCGYVYFSTTSTIQGTRQCCFFSLSLETLELELLHQGSYDGYAHPYVMDWPSSLVVDDVDSGISLS